MCWRKDGREEKLLTCGCHKHPSHHNLAELVTGCMNLWYNSPGCSLKGLRWWWWWEGRKVVAMAAGETDLSAPVPVSGIWWQKPRPSSPLPSAVNNNKVMNSERVVIGAFFLAHDLSCYGFFYSVKGFKVTTSKPFLLSSINKYKRKWSAPADKWLACPACI